LRQKRSSKPSFNAVKAENANRNRSVLRRFRAGRREGGERTGGLLSLGQREKQRNPVCRRKSSKRKLKQKCCPPLPGRAAKPPNLCAKRTAKSQKNCRKTSSLVLSEFSWLFLCPEALFAPLKLQAQIVFYCVQAALPTGFFAAFFPGKKARNPFSKPQLEDSILKTSFSIRN